MEDFFSNSRPSRMDRGEPEPVHLGIAATCGSHLVQTGDGGNAIRLGADNIGREAMECEDEPLLCAYPMCGMPEYPMAVPFEFDPRQIQRMPAVLPADSDTNVARPEINSSETAMREIETVGITITGHGAYVLLFPSVKEAGCTLLANLGYRTRRWRSTVSTTPRITRRAICGLQPTRKTTATSAILSSANSNRSTGHMQERLLFASFHPE